MGSLQPPLKLSRAFAEGRTPIARVLLVEDEGRVRVFAEAQLLRLGYKVVAVAAALDALDLLKADDDFDLLFTDVVLVGGMSGIELSKHAREVKPGLRVLLTSGYPEEVIEEHGRPANDIPLLRKPYRRGELEAALIEVLGSKTQVLTRSA